MTRIVQIKLLILLIAKRYSFAHNISISFNKSDLFCTQFQDSILEEKNQWLVYLFQVLCFTNYLDAHIPKLLVVLLRLDKLSLHVQIFSKDSGCNVLDAILKLSLFFQNV